MVEYAWSPQPGPQHALIDCPLPEVFFGGARGGGKTDGVIGKFAVRASHFGADYNAVFFRQEMPSSDDALERAQAIYGKMGAKFIQAPQPIFRFPNGARIRFRPLRALVDADKYQGQNVCDAAVEEAGLYASPAPIDRLHGILRSAAGIPTQLTLTGNPGGAGQLWLKHRYVDPAPNGMKVLERVLPNGAIHKFAFIPSKLQDNKALMEADPNYINRLYLVGSAELVKAWLTGDWSALEGAYFDGWSTDMVIPPMPLPDHWTRIVSFDWGSARPFSVGWWAVASEDFTGYGHTIPKGAMVRYREWYGCQKDERGESIPNVGLKMTAEDVAEGIRDRTLEQVRLWVADPSIFAEDGGPSLAERMKLPFVKADNRRVGTQGHLGGWDMMRQRMKGDGVPMIYTFDTCLDSCRTIPVLQHDQTRPEDVDTDGEDHCADEWRYACMARPWVSKRPETPEEKVERIQKEIRREPTLDELLQEHDRARSERF